jgi:hypothetical protein
MSLFKKKYLFSFWFWLDLIAMISMIPDLALLLTAFGGDAEDLNLSNTQASKAGKSGRSALMLKSIRMVRFSRLLRVLRVFRFFMDEENADNMEDPIDGGSTKVGQIVTESVTKKVIILVLTLVLVLPWFEPNSMSFTTAATSAARLYQNSIVKDPLNSEWTQECLSIFKMVGAEVLYLETPFDIESSSSSSLIAINKVSTINSRRKIEMWTIENIGNLKGSKLIFDIRDNIYEEAGLGMCLTFFAILIFGTSTIFISSVTMTLVVQPIARLTELLMRMSSVIGLMGGGDTVENLLKENDELFIVEALCGRMMQLFTGNGPDNQELIDNQEIEQNNKDSMAISMPGKSGQQQNSDLQSVADVKKKSNDKVVSLMASRKVTHITSGDRVWKIDVQETHRTAVIEERVQKSFKQFKQNSEKNADPVSFENYSELTTLESIINNPMALYCLRMFMTSNLTINNLLFILETDKFQKQMRKEFSLLYNKFCDNASPSQINVNAKMFKYFRSVENAENPITDIVFNEASEETWQLMQSNIFKQFLNSVHCKFYVHMKKNDPVTLNQLQLTIQTAPILKFNQKSMKSH